MKISYAKYRMFAELFHLSWRLVLQRNVEKELG